MKRAVLGLFALLALSGVRAQDGFYLGLHLDGVVGLTTSPPVVLFPGFQVGGTVVDGLELRLSASTVLLLNLLQADVLYTRGVSDTLRVYGGGGSVAISTQV